MDIFKTKIPNYQRVKCSAIIHGAALATGSAGAGLAQIPLSDSALITPIQIGMIIALGKVFEQEITESVATSILAGIIAPFVGRSVSQVAFGWVPLLGNAVNATTAASLTELIGWRVALNFYKNQLNCIDDIAQKDNLQVDSELCLHDENENIVCQLVKRAEEFIHNSKTKNENKNEYNTLLDEIENELDGLEGEEFRYLQNIYEQLLHIPEQ